MQQVNRCTLMLLIILASLLSACAQDSDMDEAVEPAHLEEIEGSDLSRITLTERAAERLGIVTVRVREEETVRTRTVGGEITLPPGTTGIASKGQSLVQVLLNTSDLELVDRNQPALILPIEPEDAGFSLTAEAVDPPVGAKATDEGTGALYYVVDSREQILEPGRRVLVEVTLLGAGVFPVVPYSSVIYDLDGATWVYTSPEPLTYVRHLITVSYIEGDRAVLLSAPPNGTEVVAVGVAELFGVEAGIGGH